MALAGSDLQGILDFVREAESFPNLPAFREGILPGLSRLVPSDLVGYNEVDTERGTSVVVVDRPDILFDDVEDALTRLAYLHPLIVRQANGDMRTYAISDFLSRRQFHASELYQDLYRRIGAEDQMAFGLPGKVIVGIAMNRDRRSFSDRDRAVLETIRPHLVQAFRHTRARERAGVLVDALASGVANAGGAVMLLGPHGRIIQADPAARRLLDTYVAREELAEWVATAPGAEPLVVDGERGRLTLRLFGDADPPVLLLEEARFGPDPGRLAALGLSPREREVLSLAARGLANDAIAGELAISAQTVRKHLERIYAKLGVHTRAAAVARAFGSDA